jgi:hypothetical protein
MRGKIVFSTLIALALAVLVLGTVWATDGILPGGTPISVMITKPSNGALISSTPGDVTLEGTASVGTGSPISSTLTALQLTVDGGAPLDISASTMPTLPQTGPATVTFSNTVSGLAPDNHTLCAIAKGSDSGGSGEVSDCIQVTVASIALAPATATNELGTPGQTHTVTATVSAGTAITVAGVTVNFDIISGPNAGKMMTATTDSKGEAVFTYTATQHLAGLGTDKIQACFVDDLGVNTCATAEKIWQDTTPPEVSVSVNPNLLWSPNHKYYQVSVTLVATDTVDPNPMVQLVSVTSSEPDNGQGDGNTTNDIVILSDFTMKLRAERSGLGNGRTYTITYTVTDASGNATTAKTTVFVPHDKAQAIALGYDRILIAKMFGDPLVFLPVIQR